MTDPKRERFEKAQARVAELEARREAVVKPLREQIEKLVEPFIDEENAAYEELCVAAESLPAIFGKCETCGAFIFEGDIGFVHSDDCIYFCADHAPTVRETLEVFAEYSRDDHSGGPEEYDRSVAFLKTQDPDAKHVWKL